MADNVYDLVVVGAGMGGLATAALAQRVGLRVALLEAHTTLGGCAGHFTRAPFTFDAGATALMGLGSREPLGSLLGFLDVPFQAVRSSTYRVLLPDRRIDLGSDPAEFERALALVFPGCITGVARFWALQSAAGEALFRAAGRIPRLPLRGVGDLVHTLGALGLRGVASSSLAAVTVDQVLRGLGLAEEREFRALVEILLLDTAQAGPETVPFANAAACLHAYRAGLSRPVGGMRALVEGIGRRFVELGGDLRTATKVDRVRSNGRGGFQVETRRGESFSAPNVALNVPLDLGAALLGESLEGRLGKAQKRSAAVWSAVTGYVAINGRAVPDDTPLFLHVLGSYQDATHDGNNVLISLSPPGDEGYGPANVRVATMSTHTHPDEWLGLDRQAHQAKKMAIGERMRAALGRALPDAPSSLVHEEYGSPRSFARYTRRTAGGVGGPPTSRTNSNLFAVGSDVFGPGIWVVGDSVFPGQGTMATVISAIRVVERIAGVGWSRLVERAEEGAGHKVQVSAERAEGG